MSLSRRLAISCLSLAFAALPACAADAPPALTPEQTDAVNKLIHDYLMNNPKALTEAMDKADADAKAEADETAKAALTARREELDNDPTSPVLGNAKGDVTVVEFFDYRCPYCKATAPGIEQLLTEDKKLRLVMKEFPILGKDSVFASRVALVAQKHGKYAEFYKAMFALKSSVNEESTLDIAKSLGLDPAQVKKEMEAPEIDAILKHNYELAKAIAADGTPAFVIGDQMTAGVLPIDQIKSQIAALRAKSKS